MGKTVESYKIALESEISHWNGFARPLRKDDRETFEKIRDMYRGYSSEAGDETNPILFEPFIMSIFVAQQKRIRPIEKEPGIKATYSSIPRQEQA